MTFYESAVLQSMDMPDVTEFGADDSLLEAMRTPAAVLAERKVPFLGFSFSF